MFNQKKSFVVIGSIAALLGYLYCVPLAWSHGTEDNHQNSIERTIEPDDSYELCLLLEQDQQLHYKFNAAQRLDFNIHYHTDDEVFYPVSKDQIMDLTAMFAAPSEQEYCLMWTNKGDADAQLSLQYEKPQAKGH